MLRLTEDTAADIRRTAWATTVLATAVWAMHRVDVVHPVVSRRAVRRVLPAAAVRVRAARPRRFATKPFPMRSQTRRPQTASRKVTERLVPATETTSTTAIRTEASALISSASPTAVRVQHPSRETNRIAGAPVVRTTILRTVEHELRLARTSLV